MEPQQQDLTNDPHVEPLSHQRTLVRPYGLINLFELPEKSNTTFIRTCNQRPLWSLVTKTRNKGRVADQSGENLTFTSLTSGT
ncbi:hypothetical protein P7K49_022768 [Saguinus oedipus]|uniref:Uncharacterized protein n=1 Tax=Saguinus oedipus TaxID=9490 RepID=A0ABQ9UJQ5_SAGOE|nr:hypothetical protein P7K49_022768 [Saguinus oedipus]